MAGFGGFLVFLGINVKRVSRMIPSNDPLRFFLAVGALSGLLSILFHSFFDFNLQIPANGMYFVMLMAIVSACTTKTYRHTPSQH
jgi:hypothetical protein